MKMNLSKKFALIVQLVFFTMLLACAMPENKADGKPVEATCQEAVKACPPISEETAGLIAKGILCLDYDLSNREIKVETETELWKDKGEMWKITLYRTKDKNGWGSGDPIVWIYKSNGERFTVKHAK
jgi:hypothetical protein